MVSNHGYETKEVTEAASGNMAVLDGHLSIYLDL